MESLIRPPIAFAHRGARAHAPENTLEAFRLALRLGAGGLESDLWLTADGVPVLAHAGTAKVGWRRRRIADSPRRVLPPWMPSLEELYDACGHDFELSLDVMDRAAAPVAVAVAREHGDAEARLWLCHGDWRRVAEWRTLSDGLRLVDSTRLRLIREGPERRAATLTDAGVDAVSLHHTDWRGGLVALFHRFERFALGWDCQHDRVLAALLAMGIDGVYSDHVDRMVEAMERAQR